MKEKFSVDLRSKQKITVGTVVAARDVVEN